jgi:predicted nucleic acid-binding protein
MTAIDTNVLIGLFNEDDSFNMQAKHGLRKAMKNGKLIIAAPVFVELSAMTHEDGWSLDAFLDKVHIGVDWLLEEQIWREAASANAGYVARRRKNFKYPRRIAADFLIGAHALVRGAELLTFDHRTFKTSFPNLKLLEV